VTKLDPDHAAAWAQLARLFMSEGQVNRADQAVAEATRLAPSDPVVQDLIGIVHSRMGEYGIANDWFRRAVDARPSHPPFLLNLANNLVYLGSTDEAVGIHERIIAVQPDNPQAHWSLAGARKATNTQHIEQLQDILDSGAHHPRAVAFYCYAVGKEYEDLEEWELAWRAFERGAAARRETVEYDEAAEIEMFDYLERSYTAGWLANSGPGHDTRAPIFVLGQPRTGTTLVERIICSHADVHSAGELQQFALAVRRIGNFRDPKRFSRAFFEAALAVEPEPVGATYVQTSRRMQGTTPHFGDKLPQALRDELTSLRQRLEAEKLG